MAVRTARVIRSRPSYSGWVAHNRIASKRGTPQKTYSEFIALAERSEGRRCSSQR